MAVETELKLRIAPEQLARLKRHPLLKKHQVTRPATRRLYNIYYDTPRLELHKAAMALRLRRAGGKWLQTLKGGGEMKAGMHRRNEWEMPVSRAALDFSTTHAAEWDEYLPLSLRKKLQPVFVTDFSRTSRMLDWQGAQVELCIDHGVVCTEHSSAPICELELELKSGEPRQLFELALSLLDIVPFQLETISKAERGYRLVSGYDRKRAKDVVPGLARDDTLPEVLQKLIWSCLAHLQDNYQGMQQSGMESPEHLHQVRVALRRLRVLLRMAGKIYADEQLSGLFGRISELCIGLGQAREWDVFVGQMLQPVCTHMAGHAGIQALLAASGQKREACYVEICGEGHVREFQRLILEFAVWMNGPYWQQYDNTAPSVREFSDRRLRKLFNRLSNFSSHPGSTDVAQLHALRILVKKLKYSVEFFAPLYRKQKARTLLAALSRVQEVLGQINDAAVAQRLLDDLATTPELSEHQEAVALVKGWVAHDLSSLLAALRTVMRRLDRQSVSWKR